MKGRLNGKLIKIAMNPSPFNQNEVNFVVIMFRDELAPIEEYSISRFLWKPILEEEEESNEHNVRNHLNRKRQKREVSSSNLWWCVIIHKPGGRVVYHL